MSPFSPGGRGLICLHTAGVQAGFFDGGDYVPKAPYELTYEALLAMWG